MYTVSVVIRTYTEDRWGYLTACLASLAQQTQPADEIVVVVDHNPALLARIAETYPQVVVVPSSVRGSAGAWNSGIRAAKGAVIAFIDDDAEAEPDWLEKLLQHYQDPWVQGVGGSINPLWHGGRPDWFPEAFQWVVGCTYRGMPENVAEVRNLIGCNMSFRRDILLAIDGFQQVEGLGHMGKQPVGCDETELSIRMHQQFPTTKLLHEPASHVWHNVPPQRSTWSYFWKRCFLEGQSKAVVSQLVGMGAGLASERAYVLKTLPGEFLQALQDGQWGRAFAVCSGLAITSLSYLWGRLKQGYTHLMSGRHWLQQEVQHARII